MFTYTLATGSRACGKTRLLELLHRLFNHGAVILGETSEILDLHIKKRTPVGVKLKEFQEQQEPGKILRCDDLVFTAITQWVHAVQERQDVIHVLLAGSPRSPRQSKLWIEHAESLRVINVHAEPHEIKTGVEQRQKTTGIIRPDESSNALENAWKDYQNLVIPSLKVFNGHAKTIFRHESMREKLEKTIDHIDIPANVRFRLRKRLNTPKHPVSIDVNELDGVVCHKLPYTF